jgi:hydroxymethylpyrimidine/phosphomethylpyrimidine kinase
VCSIGSTDPTAGAGLFADAAVYSHFGVAATFVVAGVTAQNSAGVTAVQALPPASIAAQLRAVWKQTRPDAVRIGLLPDKAASGVVARFLGSLGSRPAIVLDPVIASTSGHRFAGAPQIAALRALLKISTIATPNAAEAAELSRRSVRTVEEAEAAALALAASSKCAVLVTGGHLRGGARVVDVLARGTRVTRYSARRVARDVRGTGCLLAAALAASLARGDDLDAAIRRARSFVRRAIVSARPLGSGRPQFAVGRS